eukprot:gene19835-25783_t
MILIVIVLINLIGLSSCCQDLFIQSDLLGGLSFKQIPVDNEDYDYTVGDGRPSYFATLSDGKLIFLYHTVIEGSSTPRWVINDVFDSTNSAIAYISSWSILPNLIRFVNDNEINNYWYIPKTEEDTNEVYWEVDQSFEVLCYDDDKNYAIFFESSLEQSSLSGYYIERSVSEENPIKSKIYSLVRTHPSESFKFLYKLDRDIWMIGNNYGVDDGFAMFHSTSDSPVFFIEDEWLYSSIKENRWITDYGAIFHVNTPTDITTSYTTIYDIVRYMRSVKFMPPDQKHVTLRNDVPMPVLGLGTGGIPKEKLQDVLYNAFDVGYRLFDLAREYDNEDIIPLALLQVQNQENMPNRYDLFLQSKVWPTELGFIPTLDSLYHSLQAIESVYIDSYMLHWPECIRDIDWFHCEDTVDPIATWRESYRALEKAYSEGLINAIGISNFNTDLLRELKEFAIILPHIIQNFAEPGQMDEDVRSWCDDNNVVYQPYASLRNKHALPQELQSTIEEIANYYEISEHNVILRYIYQTGDNISLIPRSTDRIHLLDNLRVFNSFINSQYMKKLGWTRDMRSEL